MYELKQAAFLSHDNLVKNLHQYGYKPITHNLGLWKHNTKPIIVCLFADDFGTKYFNKSDTIQLLQYLQKNYIATVGWSDFFSVVSPSIENINMDMLTCQCQVMSKIYFKIFSINHLSHPNFHNLPPLHM